MARNSIGERIARLEEAQINTMKSVERLIGELEEIRKDFQRWKGFAGGVIFIVTALWAFVQIGIRSIFDRMGA